MFRIVREQGGDCYITDIDPNNPSLTVKVRQDVGHMVIVDTDQPEVTDMRQHPACPRQCGCGLYFGDESKITFLTL